jgi:hypothetical protein
MQTEGMVHALEEIHRLLKAGGSLVDIHPFVEPPRIEVHKDGRVLFTEPKPDYSTDDYRLADDALAQVIQRGLYFIERSGNFNFLVYASSVPELRDYTAETNACLDEPKEEAAAAREAEFIARVEGTLQGVGEGAEVATSERARITRLMPAK